MPVINWTTKSGNSPKLSIGRFEDIDEIRFDLTPKTGEPTVYVNLTRDAAFLLREALNQILDPGFIPVTTDSEFAETQIVGLPDQHFSLTARELRTFADVSDKLESLGLSGDDQSLILNVEGCKYRVTFGWDDTGSFGVLAATMVDD